MNKHEEIKNLQSKIENLKSDIKNCKHIWKDSKHDPETVKVQDDRAGYETHGSDRWPVLSFHDETKNRWSRECSECGHIEYTYTQEPIVTGHKPKFN